MSRLEDLQPNDAPLSRAYRDPIAWNVALAAKKGNGGPNGKVH
jgi:hypothetical protein